MRFSCILEFESIVFRTFLPFSGPLLLLSFGTSANFYIDLGVYFAISLLLLIFIKGRYERIDV
ncbi:MAG TPA: hypothetical protein DEF61_01885 [Firmicutes bacterium]|nr:hypothetical protein [Bacillota bacterium]HBM70956.1 hypothetical protein [Bacillota bacterium]HBX25024.1 hypothetical protein [Bacillota bacterium]